MGCPKIPWDAQFGRQIVKLYIEKWLSGYSALHFWLLLAAKIIHCVSFFFSSKLHVNCTIHKSLTSHGQSVRIRSQFIVKYNNIQITLFTAPEPLYCFMNDCTLNEVVH